MSRGSSPTVAAAIPTTGRPTLRRAVESVLAQTRPVDRVLVAWDVPAGPEQAELRGWLDAVGVGQIDTGGGRGPSAARTAAVGAAETDLVAFLDDDDAWAPEKLAAQVDLFVAMSAEVRYPVVSALAENRDEAGRVLLRHSVSADPEPGRLARAIFRQPWRRGSHPLVMTPSLLLVPTDLLREEPFDPQRRLHEDWEWLLRVDRRPDTRIGVVDRHLTGMYVDTPGPRAGRPAGAWRTSMSFADQMRLPAGVLGDFLLCRVLPGALEDEGLRGAMPVLGRGLAGRPSPGALRQAGGRLVRHLVGA